MHFAANALVGESMQNPSKYFRNNIGNGLNLLDAMVATGVKRLVFSSTCATFGPPERVPIDETLPQRPINPYGESKLAFEKILRWYDEIHGLRFVALRYFNAAGASENFGEDHRIETHLIPNVLKVALGQKPTSRSTGQITRRRMAPAFAITSTFSIWPGRTFSRSMRRRASFTISAPAAAPACVKSSTCCRKVTGHKIPGGGKTSAPGRSAAADRRFGEDSDGNWAGSRNSKISKRSSRAPGNGTRNFRTATGIRILLLLIMILLCDRERSSPAGE